MWYYKWTLVLIHASFKAHLVNKATRLAGNSGLRNTIQLLEWGSWNEVFSLKVPRDISMIRDWKSCF